MTSTLYFLVYSICLICFKTTQYGNSLYTLNYLEGAVHEEHMEMDHSSSEKIPDQLKDADNSHSPIGSKVEITTEHMSGMKGAIAVVEGAFDTTTYTNN